jgi:hypothetical protein
LLPVGALRADRVEGGPVTDCRAASLSENGVQGPTPECARGPAYTAVTFWVVAGVVKITKLNLLAILLSQNGDRHVNANGCVDIAHVEHRHDYA